MKKILAFHADRKLAFHSRLHGVSNQIQWCLQAPGCQHQAGFEFSEYLSFLSEQFGQLTQYTIYKIKITSKGK